MLLSNSPPERLFLVFSRPIFGYSSSYLAHYISEFFSVLLDNSQITTQRLLTNYESLALAEACSYLALITKISSFLLIYVLPLGLWFLPLLLRVLFPLIPSGNLLLLPRAFSVCKSHLYLLPGYWLLSFSLNQSQWHIFTQCNQISCNSLKCHQSMILEKQAFPSRAEQSLLCRRHLSTVSPWKLQSRENLPKPRLFDLKYERT